MTEPSFSSFDPHAKSLGCFSVFAWSAWLRLLAMMPFLALLWLGVWWALRESWR